jgi:hypothetical protein
MIFCSLYLSLLSDLFFPASGRHIGSLEKNFNRRFKNPLSTAVLFVF